MKNWLKKGIIVFTGILLIFILFNQIGQKELPIKDHPNLKDGRFARDNGFYLLWSMLEPQDVDIYGPEVFKKYQQLFDPQLDNKVHIQAWGKNAKNMQKQIWAKESKENELLEAINWLGDYRDDKCQHLLKYKETILKAQTKMSAWIKRYQDMMTNKQWEDFTTIDHLDIMIPPLLNWLRMTKLVTSIHMLDALTGNWQQGVERLIEQINFAKRINSRTRFHITNLIVKANLKIPLWAIISLMNQPECPTEIYVKVLDECPPLKYSEYGTISMFYEGLQGVRQIFANRKYHEKFSFIEKILSPILMQKSRSQNYFVKYIQTFIQYEQTPPYEWKQDFNPRNPKNNVTWWLFNPVGKSMYSRFLEKAIANDQAFILKSLYSKALMDMARISAELHLEFTPDKPVQDILNDLESYQKLPDPGSGKPYVWNDHQQILYSLGMDRDDDSGKGDPIKSIDTDFAIPVILYLR